MEYIVGPGRPYAHIRDVCNLKPVNAIVRVDPTPPDSPDYYRDKLFFVQSSGMTIICEGGLEAPAVHGMTRRPSINKDAQTQLASRLGLGADGSISDADRAQANTYAQPYLAPLPYLKSSVVIPLPDGSTITLAVKWWAGMDKGICTVKAGTRDCHVEGIEFFNAIIGSSYNGAGIRGQGVGLSVEKCIFRDNQNGVMTSDQRDSSGRVIGYVSIKNCIAWNNGYDGLQHDTYLGECARQINQFADFKNQKQGHHSKFHSAGGVSIDYAGSYMDDENAVTSKPSTHCAVDGTSGHVVVVNPRIRKVHSTDSGSNQGKALYHSNYRDFSEIGNNLILVGGYIESLCRKRGQFVRIEEYAHLKDPDDSRPPGPIFGYVGRNVLRFRKNTTQPGYDYGHTPFAVPAGVALADNQVVEMAEPFTETPIDMDGAPELTPQSMIPWLAFVRDRSPAEAKPAFDRTIAALEQIETYDPMAEEDPVAIAELKAQLAAAQQSVATLETEIAAKDEEIAALQNKVTALQDKIDRADALGEQQQQVLDEGE